MKMRQTPLPSQPLRSRKHAFLTTLLFCLLVSMSIAVASACSGQPPPPPLRSAQTPSKRVTRPKNPTAPAITMTQMLATRFMDALLVHDYHSMWTLLHPAIQAKWANEISFTTFWNTRFHEYTLISFTLSKVQPLDVWVDPETMTPYHHLEEVFVSLQLQLTQAKAAAALPPEVQHPTQLYQHQPFIVYHPGDEHKSEGAWSVLVGGPADLEAPLLPPLTPPDIRLYVPILMYHHISDDNPQPSPFYWNVTIEHFQQQMDALATLGYHAITMNMLLDALYDGFALPSRPMILTFDDGREDAYQNAYPILLTHHFSALFYLPSGWVGQAGQMTWAQLRDMLTHGMQMGAHTIDHVNLRTLLLNSPAEAQRQLQHSKQTIEQQLGIVVQHFCYPYGEPFYLGTQDERQQIVKLLAADGYLDATVAVGVVSGIVQTSQAPFALPRVPVFGFESTESFRVRLPWH